MRDFIFGKWLAVLVLPLALAPLAAQGFGVAPGRQPTLLVMDGAGDAELLLRISCHDTEEPVEEEPSEPDFPSGPGFPTDFDLLQSTGDSGDCDDDPIEKKLISTSSTDLIVKSIRDADRTCGKMRLVPVRKGVDLKLYRIDCYRLAYRRIAEALPPTGDYAPIRRALLTASDKLNQIVRANQDPDADRIKVRERGKPAAPATGPIRAIRPDRIDVAMAQAEAVIEEAAIVILRSGEIPTRRNIHYAQVSAAVEDSLAVLRST